eukprot:gb/GECH01005170.1/.p1 GENE.gb/GECH01005170.1/~~gb/GECH01005170.1/.p1  ORF type:complete len:228 (+),score=47.46 gb/GECH01005170.1/:1-684(+)
MAYHAITFSFLILAILGGMIISMVDSTPVGFYLRERKKYCFYEDADPYTTFIFKYHCPDFGPKARELLSDNPVGIKMRVSDPFGREVFKSTLEKEHDAFDFTTGRVPGEYKLCFGTNTTHWFWKQKFDFKLFVELESEADAADDETLTSKDTIVDLKYALRRLNRKVNTIKNEQSYFKRREKRFRQTTDSTNGRVLFWSVIQTVIVVGAAVVQLELLKRFFKAKKVV